MYDRLTLIETLRSGTYNVTFTKVNGDIITMPCTLKAELLPPAGNTKPINEEVLSVWCTDKNAWRSFRVANVSKVEAL